MSFYADLHVHSKYSRATSRDLDLEHLAWWAAVKGIGVVGTGDCVHPLWLAEIKDKLVARGNGLFRLRPEIEAEVWKSLPASCRRSVEFMLSTEISTIYKKGDKTRKIHHLIYASNLDAVDRLAARLARVGNIASDGRPILGLDSRDLLEIALDSGPDSYLVPAHIWTPWFAALGSQSGFDSIADCYGDLADHIFAVETGLSSDPAMNWRVSFLDRYRLTSNSDAHSPGKLGREATRFTGAADYLSIRRALETGQGYGGTVEFFPEEGKYHMDGHRACGVRLDPRETLAAGGVCPACGGRLTIGVAHRVEVLADRAEGDVVPATSGSVQSFVPLPEILSEIVGAGVAAKAVQAAYGRVTAALGPELCVLGEVPVEDVERADPLLGEAVARLRSGTVIREAGYDGEYGVIKLFGDGELSRFTKGELLFDAPVRKRQKVLPETSVARPAGGPGTAAHETALERASGLGMLAGLDEDQARAAAAVDGPLVVLAGPGSGKTRLLVHRLAHLVAERGVPAEACLAITFTRRAMEELRLRLAALTPAQVAVHSFHSLGLTILRAHAEQFGLLPDFRIADEAERKAALAAALGVSEAKAARLVNAASVLKRTGMPGEGETREALMTLRRLGRERNWVDFDDLVALPVELLETHADMALLWRSRFRHICADEFQDVDDQQYSLLRLLAGPGGNLCVIGDPDQAIYGFRGADAACFQRFASDFPAAGTMSLHRNYRSTGTIVKAAAEVIGKDGTGSAMRTMQERVCVHAAPNERAEAAFVAATIEQLMGGHDMLEANRQKRRGKPGRALGFGDFAILYRGGAQAAALREALDRAGIPFRRSSPAPIADHAGVRALLSALKRPDVGTAIGLDARLKAANEWTRRQPEADIAALADAERWLRHLAGSVADDEARLREEVALATEADFLDLRADRVSLLTMHAAKGLEFSVVFVVGLEDGLVPLRWGGAPDETVEPEERRLFYVAMTRARDRLFLSHAAERLRKGKLAPSRPSPFLDAIPADLTLELHTAPRERKPQQYSLF